MKLKKYLPSVALGVLITTMSGCAWFRGETAQPSNMNTQQMPAQNVQADTLPGMNSSDGDIVMDLGGSAETLPARPNKEWQPSPNQKVTVYFAFDQSTIGTAQIPQLEAVANYLKQHSNVGLIIQGNCDERGSHEYNIGLGERRALAVRDYLVSLGVPDSHLQTLSYGSERPAVEGHSESAFSKNRRAELIPAKM